MPQVLGSKWGSGGESGRLNPNLLGTIYPVKPDGSPMLVDASGAEMPSVLAPVTDANIEMSANWQSPFEQTGAESKAPTIMSMLQLGTLDSYVTTLFGKGSEKDTVSGSIAGALRDFSARAQGSTGMTKMNSTQVFTGAPPVKISLTLHFRAFDDPISEVQAPVDQLSQWHLAQKLAPDSALVNLFKGLKDGAGFIKSLLPSRVPQMVGFRYGGLTFSPMVIENLSYPLTTPRTKDGKALRHEVQIHLSTLTALDANDWRRARAGYPTVLSNNQTQ